MHSIKPPNIFRHLFFATDLAGPFDTLCRHTVIMLCLLFLVFDRIEARQSALPTSEQIELQIEKDIETALEQIDPEEDDPSQIIDTILELAANPININRASAEQLLEVPGMTHAMADAIVEYRQNVRPFRHAADLVEVDGIGRITRNRLLPYLTTDDHSPIRRDIWFDRRTWTYNSRAELYFRFQDILEKQDGYQIPDTSSGYLGSSANLYSRARYQSSHLSASFTQMKRPGEPLKNPVESIHTSFHLAIRNIGNINTLVVGDYNLRFGQGLIFGRSGFGKSREVIASSSGNPNHLRGNTSGRSADTFRGAAINTDGTVSTTLFYSRRSRPASRVEGDSIRTPTGFYAERTRSEQERLGGVREFTTGGRLQLELSQGIVGVSGYINRFNRPVQRGSQPWQINNPYGDQFYAAAGDYRFSLGNFHLFGESGITSKEGRGLVSGLQWRGRPGTEFSLIFRSYGKSFHSLFGGSFAEQSGFPRNEQGFYLGFLQPIGESVRVRGFYDQFRFPAPRFQTRQPTEGHEWLIGLDFEPETQPEIELYGVLRQKTRMTEVSASDRYGREIRRLSPEKKLSARVHLSWQADPRLRLRYRIDWVRFEPAGVLLNDSGLNGLQPLETGSTGMLLFQDARIRVSENLQFDIRLTLFDTDGFDTRLYHFENDLLYLFSSTMLFDRGQRHYILVNYKLHDRIQFRLKLSSTRYENRNEISSGLNRIEGNRRREIGAQIRLTY